MTSTNPTRWKEILQRKKEDTFYQSTIKRNPTYLKCLLSCSSKLKNLYSKRIWKVWCPLASLDHIEYMSIIFLEFIFFLFNNILLGVVQTLSWIKSNKIELFPSPNWNIGPTFATPSPNKGLKGHFAPQQLLKCVWSLIIYYGLLFMPCQTLGQ